MPPGFACTLLYHTTGQPAQIPHSTHTHILKPVGPAVLLVQPCLAVGEAAGDAALALGGVGAVEVGDVLVADIAEPISEATELAVLSSGTR